MLLWKVRLKCQLKIINQSQKPISFRKFRPCHLWTLQAIIMSDWSQRLQKIQANNPADEVESIDHLTLEDLKMEKMTHTGRSYLEVWNTSLHTHYSASNKTAHRKMIMFIKLSRLQWLPRAMLPRRALPCAPRPKPCQWWQRAPRAQWRIHGWRPTIQHLQARMLNMENVLQQILQHLVPNPAEPFPTMPIDEEWNDPRNNWRLRSSRVTQLWQV